MSAADARRNLVFTARGHRYAVPAETVREIARMPRLRPVPQAPPVLLGIGNFRGEMLAVLSPQPSDLADRLDRERQALILTGAERVALAIDEVEGFATDIAADAMPFPIEDFIQHELPAGNASRRRGGVDRMSADPKPHDHLALLCFTVGAQMFALREEEVERVMALPPEIDTFPGADPILIGTCLYKEGVLPLVSMPTLLGLPQRSRTRSVILIARFGQSHVGLVVDRIEKLQRIGAEQVDTVPPLLFRTVGQARISAIGRSTHGTLVALLATSMLFDDALTARINAVGRSVRAATCEVADTVASSRLRFRVGADCLSLPIEAVARIAPIPRLITRIPGASSALCGVAMIDGVPMPIVNLCLLLTGRETTGRQRLVIVVKAGGANAGFLVDDVDGVSVAHVDEMARAPVREAHVAEVFFDVLQFHDHEEGVLLLSADALLARVERELLAQHGPRASAF